MGLKEEIDKLIQAERQKLENRDQKATKFREHQAERFDALRLVLEEVVRSVHRDYVNLEIFPDGSQATLSVGKNEWSITPDYTPKSGRYRDDYEEYDDDDDDELEPSPGFRVREQEFARAKKF